MIRQHLAILADNKPGVLTHVAGLISRRAINIECVNAGYTEEPDVTRINIVVSVEDRFELDQAVKLAKNTPPDDGPGEEDGPWAEGWAERSGQKPPTGYTAEELERDSPFNAWLHDGDVPDERDE